jgi:hypothetical protein
MPPILRHVVRYAAQRLASDPTLRDKAVKAARVVAEEAREIGRDPDRPRAAGRAVRRVLNRLRESE